MKIEIDQSGKVEETARITVIGDSKGNIITIKSKDKQIIQEIYRKEKQPRKFVIQLFSLLTTFLIAKTIDNSITYSIDTEYPNKEEEITSLILYFSEILNIKISRHQIQFKRIGKSSLAHKTSHKGYKEKK